MPKRSGFTLVELLVVIGLVSLLIAFLLPALNRAREASQRVACASNLHQIGLGFLTYASENRSMMPCFTAAELGYGGPNPGSLGGNAQWLVMGNPNKTDGTPFLNAYTGLSWARPMNKYLNLPNDPAGGRGRNYRIFQCPSDHGPSEGNPNLWTTSDASMFERSGTSYQYVTGALRVGVPTLFPGTGYAIDYNEWGCWGRPLSRIRRSSRQVMLTEWGFLWGMRQEYAGWSDAGYLQAHGRTKPLNNMCFVDGHVSLVEMRKKPYHWNNADYEFSSK